MSHSKSDNIRDNTTFARLSLDYDSANSMVNQLPVLLEERIRKLPEAWKNQTEEELEKLVQNKLGPTGERLRKALWAEYGRALDENSKMNEAMIYSAVCAEQTYKRLVNNPETLAWLCVPPPKYHQTVDDLLDRSLLRIREIIQFPLYTETGSPNTRCAELILKCFQMLDLRAKGSIVQRIESKSLNVSVTKDVQNFDGQSLEDINKQIAELENKQREIQGILPAPGSELVGLKEVINVNTVDANGKEKRSKANKKT